MPCTIQAAKSIWGKYNNKGVSNYGVALAIYNVSLEVMEIKTNALFKRGK